MTAFFRDLSLYPSLRCALAAGVLAALVSGVVGSLVVVRRSTYLAGAIAHGVLAGLGLSRYLERVHGVAWLPPMAGAALAAVLAAFAIAFAGRNGRERNDTVLSAIWCVGTAAGVSLMAMTPGYQDDLMGYLFGSLSLSGPSEVAWMAGLAGVVLLTTVLCFDRFLAIAFSAEMARLRGVPVFLYECVFLVVTALAVVMLAQVAGIVLAIALLSLPAAAAGLVTSRLGHMMGLAAAIGVACTAGGLAMGYAADLPTGATTVELIAGVYLLMALGKRLVARKGLRRRRPGGDGQSPRSSASAAAS
ncbi:MAG: metal ABC transporter permease [Kiritimatiellia bacterium]|jgi:zinc transport system permease protein